MAAQTSPRLSGTLGVVAPRHKGHPNQRSGGGWRGWKHRERGDIPELSLASSAPTQPPRSHPYGQEGDEDVSVVAAVNTPRFKGARLPNRGVERNRHQRKHPRKTAAQAPSVQNDSASSKNKSWGREDTQLEQALTPTRTPTVPARRRGLAARCTFPAAGDRGGVGGRASPTVAGVAAVVVRPSRSR